MNDNTNVNHSNVVKASEVCGVKVKNSNNDNLGSINDLVIDKLSGQVSYVVLDFGGFLSFGNKFFALPWKLFSYDPNDGCFIVNVDKERLENAPGFDKDQWPDFASSSFTTAINNYYS